MTFVARCVAVVLVLVWGALAQADLDAKLLSTQEVTNAQMEAEKARILAEKMIDRRNRLTNELLSPGRVCMGNTGRIRARKGKDGTGRDWVSRGARPPMRRRCHGCQCPRGGTASYELPTRTLPLPRYPLPRRAAHAGGVRSASSAR